MSMYIFISEEDRVTKRKVSDPEVNECFQEALKFDQSLMIEERKVSVRKTFFKKEDKFTYHLYHESPTWDGKPYQARYQFSGSGFAPTVLSYLHGIINGVHNMRTRDNIGKKYSHD